jgi:hypothetical protein
VDFDGVTDIEGIEVGLELFFFYYVYYFHFK